MSLHALWTKAVGQPGYNKVEWRAFQAYIERLERERTQLLHAADDALVTFEDGGQPGGPLLRLRDAVDQIRRG